MSKETWLFYNGANNDVGRYPRQVRTISDVEVGLRRRGNDVNKIAIDFYGDDTLDVLQNVVKQIRPLFEKLLGKKIVTCNGDGGTSLILRALASLIAEEQEEGLNAPFVAPAGTYNLLSKELGTSTVKDLLRAIDGDLQTRVQRIRMRDMVVSTYSDKRDQKLDEVTYPWSLFAGYGVDGRIIAQSEFAPRNRPNIVNALIITASMLKYISLPERGATTIDTYSAMAIPYYGPYRFDKSLSRLGEPSFQTITYHTDFGFEALEYFAVINGIGLSRKVNSALWKFLEETEMGKDLTKRSKLMTIAAEVSLEEKKELGFTMKPGTHYLHLDGYPMIVVVEDGQFCRVNMKSGDMSMDVMKVVE